MVIIQAVQEPGLSPQFPYSVLAFLFATPMNSLTENPIPFPNFNSLPYLLTNYSHFSPGPA